MLEHKKFAKERQHTRLEMKPYFSQSHVSNVYYTIHSTSDTRPCRPITVHNLAASRRNILSSTPYLAPLLSPIPLCILYCRYPLQLRHPVPDCPRVLSSLPTPTSSSTTPLHHHRKPIYVPSPTILLLCSVSLLPVTYHLAKAAATTYPPNI